MKNNFLILAIGYFLIITNQEAYSQSFKINPIGSFDNMGVPKYLDKPDDIIDTGFVSDINNVLPEFKSVPVYHSDYLNNKETDIKIIDSAEVWVTFVHEGAAFLNSLGFFSYNTTKPVEKISELKELKIIFPNTSEKNHGGGLLPGNKVKIGVFGPNTTISWVLLSNGFQNGKVTIGNYPLFSESKFNPEKNTKLKQHTVLLYEEKREKYLIGFEDADREKGTDDDFNDLVFYVTANPFSAISSNNVVPFNPQRIHPLNNIYFESGKSTLMPKSFNELDQMAAYVISKPNIKFEIGGHTDNIGNRNANQKLSEDRANAVMLYLIKKGVSSKQLKAKGYGDTISKGSNESEDGRKSNRRTEIKESKY